METMETNADIQNVAIKTYKSLEENGTTNKYTFSVLATNIAAVNKDVNLCVRAYVVCEDAEGNEHILYGKTLTANVASVYRRAV